MRHLWTAALATRLPASALPWPKYETLVRRFHFLVVAARDDGAALAADVLLVLGVLLVAADFIVHRLVDQ